MRRGYAEIRRLSARAPSDQYWTDFTVGILRLPGWKLPAVQEVVKQGGWQKAVNPIGYLKTASLHEASAMGLREDGYKAAPDRSRRCPCGYTTRAKAEKSGHVCITGEVGAIEDIRIPEAAWSDTDDDEPTSRSSFAGAHDKAIDLLLLADEINYGRCDEPFFIEDETGRRFIGSDCLRSVKREFIQLSVKPHVEWEDEWDGTASVDWVKAAQTLGLARFECTVLFMRCSMGYSRQRLIDIAPWSESWRLSVQAAWKAIDRRQNQLKKIIREDRRLLTGPPRTAPPTRRVAIPRPDLLKENDSEVLKALDDRFPSPEKDLRWGQKLRSGRRY